MHENVSPAGLALTLWTARTAVAGWFGLLLQGPRIDSASHFRLARGLWTGGALAMAVHVLCAFGFVHGWSHSAAWEHTARRTAEVTGLEWGGGLFFNEAFLLWWLFDAATLWRSPVPAWRRSLWYEIVLHAWFAFLMINATVVFGHPGWRIAGLVGAAALFVAYVYRKRMRPAAPT